MRAGPAGGSGSGSGAAALPARLGPACGEQVPGGGGLRAGDTGVFCPGRHGSSDAVPAEGHLRRRRVEPGTARRGVERAGPWDRAPPPGGRGSASFPPHSVCGGEPLRGARCLEGPGGRRGEGERGEERWGR